MNEKAQLRLCLVMLVVGVLIARCLVLVLACRRCFPCWVCCFVHYVYFVFIEARGRLMLSQTINLRMFSENQHECCFRQFPSTSRVRLGFPCVFVRVLIAALLLLLLLLPMLPSKVHWRGERFYLNVCRLVSRKWTHRMSRKACQSCFAQ